MKYNKSSKTTEIMTKGDDYYNRDFMKKVKEIHRQELLKKTKATYKSIFDVAVNSK